MLQLVPQNVQVFENQRRTPFDQLKLRQVGGYFWLEYERFLVLVLMVLDGPRERRVYLGVPKGGGERRLVDATLSKAGVNRWYPDENPFAEARPGGSAGRVGLGSGVDRARPA
jgi:hypothetical protein